MRHVRHPDGPSCSGFALPGAGFARAPAVMADVGDEAAALLVDRRLVGRAPLEVVVTDQLHVVRLGAVAARRRLRRGRAGREGGHGEGENETRERSWRRHHGRFTLRSSNGPEYAKLLIRLIPGSSTRGPTPQMNASS